MIFQIRSAISLEEIRMTKKAFSMACASLLAAGLIMSCASGPEIKPEPESKPIPPPKPAGFVMKPFQRSMSDEMAGSYDMADEIIIGVFDNFYEDDQFGIVYNFADFRTFDKNTLTWGKTMNVLMKIQPDRIKPEIIYRTEYRELIELDRVGICWDVYEGGRNVFLVEGRKNLLFVKLGYDEASNRSYRNLIDAYPVTEVCQADKVFTLMIQRLISGEFPRDRSINR
jgi:hypothetical protein